MGKTFKMDFITPTQKCYSTYALMQCIRTSMKNSWLFARIRTPHQDPSAQDSVATLPLQPVDKCTSLMAH